MSSNRCPWCGKRINRVSDQRGVVKKETPRYLRFARCSHCGNYYGQKVRSSHVRACLLTAVGVLIAGCLLQNGIVLILAIPIVTVAVFAPLERMDENESVAEWEGVRFRAKFCGEGRLKKKKCYLLRNDFDNYESRSVVSPIYVLSYHKKTDEFEFMFFYDHPCNPNYSDGELFTLFDDNANEAGTAHILTN